MNKIKLYTEKIFEDIKYIDEVCNEYWYARELQRVLEYKNWRNFNRVIDKSIISANISYPNENYWGVEVNIPINSGKGKIKDYKLSRYACYLIEQNGNSHMKVISLT